MTTLAFVGKAASLKEYQSKNNLAIKKVRILNYAFALCHQILVSYSTIG